MLKKQIQELFENYENNKLIDVPMLDFKPNRNPFEYLPPQKMLFKDLRVSLKPRPVDIDIKTQSITDKVKRYADQFQFRKAFKSRIFTHTLQYTALSCLVVFGFYSRQFSGTKRFQHVLKQTLKTALYSGTIFTVNEILYPFYYKYSHERQLKPRFTINNLLSAISVLPIVLLFERNLLVSIRKALFICAFGQLRDYQTEEQRFYKLNPDHPSTIGKHEAERIRHPFEDPTKRLPASLNSRAQQERRKQEREKLERQTLAERNGEKIPSSNLYMILPEVYRPPTAEEKREHEIKATKKTQQLLKQRGIQWLSVHLDETVDKKKE